MSASFLAFEAGVRGGDVVAAVEVVLDELEHRGALGVGERVTQLREQIHGIARQRAAIWAQQPELARVDFYARTLDLSELDRLREEWDAALDARGPWLRPLRGWRSDAAVVAELRACEAVPLDRVMGLRFEGEDALVFGLREAEDGAGASSPTWSWAQGQVVGRRDLAPVRPRYVPDPRFEDGADAPLYRPRPEARARPLPWPELGRAHAQMSADGKTIFVRGWYDDNYGLLEWVDERTLELRAQHEFERAVAAVVDRPGSDEVLVATYGELAIVSPSGLRWRRGGGTHQLAWSPSGRYVGAADEHVARIFDTHAAPPPVVRDDGMPPSFSPDGARFVDGRSLFDGRTGRRIARLDLRLGQYLEGGPAWPWWHVGTELILSIHSHLQVWDAKSGAAVTECGDLRVPHWDSIAYSRSGRHFVRGHGNGVELGELPSARILGELEFEVEIEALALAPDAGLVAAYGSGAVELRRRSGELVATHALVPPRSGGRDPMRGASFEFAEDGRSLSLQIAEQRLQHYSRDHGSVTEVRAAVACTWEIGGASMRLQPEAPADRQPLAPGWSVESGPISVFCHVSGVCVSLPCAGPWQANPGEPTIVACPGGMFELRGAT